MSSLDTVLKPKTDLFLKAQSPCDTKSSIAELSEAHRPFDLHFHKWKRNLSLHTILWLPCNWPTGKFGSLSMFAHFFK